MKPTSALLAYGLLGLVMTLGSRVKGQQCSPGQVTHKVDEGIRCCYPADCGPNSYLDYCAKDGESDMCKECPRGYALYKRTSSFAVESCHIFPLDHDCKALPGSPKATDDDFKHCSCNLETGVYFLKPEVPLIKASNCQPFLNACHAGYQPNLRGNCEPCPKNMVQNKSDEFVLCRPQRNCTAMRLDVLVPGNASVETVCAEPPVVTPRVDTQTTTTPAPLSTKTTTATTTTSPPADVSVRPSTEQTGGGDNAELIIVVAVLCSLLVLSLLAFAIYRRHHLKQLCAKATNCHGLNHSDNLSYQVSHMSGAGRDSDNTSDNSCCACTDSCLSTSSSKGACGSSVGASVSGYTKNAGGLPLDAYGNMNGKVSQLSPSEPLYNSISHDGGMECKADGGQAMYKNVNGVAPTMLRQEDFNYNYPNKVRLPSSDEEDEDSLKKDVYWGRGANGYGQPQKAGARGGGDESRETEPLLPGSDNTSSGIPTPVTTPGLRGILRNGPNRPEPLGPGVGRGGAKMCSEGGVMLPKTPGNRPHLSILLSDSANTGSYSGGESISDITHPHNLPHLSQLVSQQQSVTGVVGQPSHQPPLPPLSAAQQQQPQKHQQPEQVVNELPLQLQQYFQQQQQQQEVSTLPIRLMPVPSIPQTQPNPSLVQMEELKPVLPLHPSPVNPESPALVVEAVNVPDNQGRLGQTLVKGRSEFPAVAETNARENKGRAGSGSPARINPSQQEELKPATRPPNISPVMLTNGSGGGSAKGAALATSKGEKDINEETFQKQPMQGAPSLEADGEDEETAHKSVGGSSGLGDSLDLSPISMPCEEGRRSRTPYRRSMSEVSRSVSPSLPAPPSRSISSPEEKHRPFAVVKPMQSNQSLNRIYSSQDRLAEPLEYAHRLFPLHSMDPSSPVRQSSQDSSDDPENVRTHDNADNRTRGNFYNHNDSDHSENDDDNAGGGKDKPAEGGSDG